LKTLFTLLSLAFFSVTAAFPQATDSLPEARFQTFTTAGVKCGVNISSFNNFNRDNKIGLVIGFTGEYRFSRTLGLTAELNYSQQGAILPQPGPNLSGPSHYDIEYGLNYLALPVLISLHEQNFTMQGGVYGAVLLKAKARNGKITEDVTQHFAPHESGLCLGLAYQFWGHTVFGLRIYQGLQNSNKSLPDTRAALQNSTFQITAGYTL
jgi:hypothetical protein